MRDDPTAAVTRRPARLTAGSLAALLLGATVVGAWLVPVPDDQRLPWQATIVIVAATIAWALAILPDYVVGLGLLTIYHAAGLGPTAASLSGFASSGWFLLLGVLTLGVALSRSGLLERFALWLLLAFPPTFAGQTVALALIGAAMTPMLPFTVGRCALVAPLAARLARILGCDPESRGALGLGLAAFLGSGLVSRSFMSGAALNLIAWQLLPAGARPTWTDWALAALPATVVMLGGPLVTLLAFFRPPGSCRTDRSEIAAQLAARGAVTPREWATGVAAAAALCGFIAGPHAGIDAPWIACGSAFMLLSAGVLNREDFRSGIDWPLLILLGVLLGLPAMMQHAGLDTRIASAVTSLVPDGVSPFVTVLSVLGATMVARFLLSEWVAVPLLTLTFLPLAAQHGIHPWIIAFVVLIGSNAWFFPYQFAAYAAFLAESRGELFHPRQARFFTVVYVAFSLLGVVCALPFWRAFGLIP